MKNIYLLFFACFIAFSTSAQIKYDDGPIVLGNDFTLDGTWGRNNISYSFQNGTTDIPNDDEQNAIRQAF